VRAILERLEDAGAPASALLAPLEGRSLPLDCDIALFPPEEHAAAKSALEQAGGPIATLALVRHGDGPVVDASFAAALPIDGRPALLKRMIEEVWRDAIAVRELQARRATMIELGLDAGSVAFDGSEEPSAPLVALFAGRPNAGFFDLEQAFARLDTRLDAALTISSAFDRLHEAAVDALIINLEGAEEGGLALCGAIRRNARLEGLPCGVLAATPSLAKAAFGKGALEAGEPQVVARDGAPWIVAAAKRRVRRRCVSQALQEAAAALRTVDAAFERHLVRLARQHQADGRPLSLAVFSLQGPFAGLGGKRACDEAFDMVSGLVRASDLALRLREDTLGVLLPCAAREEARELAQRAVGVLESTGFVGMEGPLKLRRMVCELATGESGEGLLARALAGLSAAPGVRLG